MSSPDRIDSNDLGIDDVVINDVKMFRLERMSDTHFWLCCYTADDEKDERYGERIVFQVGIEDGKLIVTGDEGADKVPGEKP